MSKKVKLTAKEEMFCRAMALAPSNGMTQRACYIKAYNTGNMDDATIDAAASKVANKYKIGIRIEELTKEFQSFLNYDAKAHFDELDDEHKRAVDGGEIELTKEGADGKDITIKKASSGFNSVALKAVELKGKMTGRYTDKHEHTGKDGVPLMPYTSIKILGVGDDEEKEKK